MRVKDDVVTLLATSYGAHSRVLKREGNSISVNQLLNFNRVWDYMTDHCFKYKTYRLLSPFRSEGSYNYNNLKDLLGDGIFAVDGDKWRHRRKISSYEFEFSLSDRNSKFQDLFLKATLDSTLQVAFGIQLDSMCGSSDEGTLFANAFDDSSEMTAWRYVDASWTIKRFLNIGPEAKLKKNVKVIDEFVYKLIHTKIDQMSCSPNDASVTYLPYAMGRMKFIWGDDAEVFRPERWLNNNGVFQNESPFKFTAFQAGPRICLGKDFAYMQMKIFSATKVVNYRTMINLHIKGGLHLHAFPKIG
ncbi:hypothetical protein C5167_048597 [Papaver somniferum]|uniref:Cytochrome P450 n=1 Tax=Papaver somniferum TaxID=3469 RepID=A0A4Y7KLZ0_PAPSO|nr:hypothetical protein C5167_048597 [Papaver somniferum]